MLRIIAQVAIIIAFQASAWGYSIMLDSRALYDNSSNALTVVEVTGPLRGSGVLVLLDDKPVVITNSHNLQGRKQARVRLPEISVSYFDVQDRKFIDLKTSFSADLSVQHDNPLRDFVILSLQDRVPARTFRTLEYLARFNGNFCVSAPGCRKGWNPNPVGVKTIESHIGAILNGKQTAIALIKGASHRLVDDKIISGGNFKIFSVPVYARPGVSGGAYFYQGQLEGLLTKVSLIGTPETYAMPFKEIGRALVSSEHDGISAEWVNGALVVQVGGDEITVQSDRNGGGETGNGGGETGNGGGETGNGGGETGNGGGETGNGGDDLSSAYWTMEFKQLFSTQRVMTWNPFIRRPGKFLLNGNDVAFLNVRNTRQAPSLPLYLWNHQKRIRQTPMPREEIAMAALESERHRPMNEAVCGRISHYNPAQKLFSVLRGIQTTEANDGILFVLPDNRGNYPREYHEHGGPAAIVSVPQAWKDSLGQYRTIFTAAKRSPGFLFDLIQTEVLVPLGPVQDAVSGLRIRISEDLAQLEIYMTGSVPRKLERLPSRSITAISFATPEKDIRVSLNYDTHDLTRLERAYINFQGRLVELGPCDKFVGVK